MMFTDTTREAKLAKDPAVICYKGSYYLYYTTLPEGGHSSFNNWAIGIAKSSDGDKFSKVADFLPEQEIEQNGICAPAAIEIDGVLHLFYQSYGNFPNDKICHASSIDGVNFIHDTNNPIWFPEKSDWTCGRAIDADVVIFKNKLWLYYATRDVSCKIQFVRAAVSDIPKKGEPLKFIEVAKNSILYPTLDWEKDCIEAPAVIDHDNKLYMFYAGAYNNEPQQIGCAVSDDGINFERIFPEPFLTNGEKGEWNSSESGHPYVYLEKDGRCRLYFQGNNDNGKSWYISYVDVGFCEGKPYIKK